MSKRLLMRSQFLTFSGKTRRVTGLRAQQALSNAPRQANGLFIVPKVVE